MGSVVALLMGLAGPIAKRVLVSLGISLVTYTGLTAALESVLTQAQQAFGGLPSDVVQFLAIAGVWHGLSIVAGAMVARLALAPLKRLLPTGSSS